LRVLVEIASIHAQKGDHLAERDFERRVEPTGLNVNELRGELGEECLEPQALLE
jgi:hypothetical protein